MKIIAHLWPKETDLYWHFLTDGGHMAHDRAGSKVLPGVTYRIEGPIQMGERGFHMNARALDALCYAPSTWVQRCYPGDVVIRGDVTIVSNARTAIAVFDARHALLEFIVWWWQQTEYPFDLSPEGKAAYLRAVQEHMELLEAERASYKASGGKVIGRADSTGTERAIIANAVLSLLVVEDPMEALIAGVDLSDVLGQVEYVCALHERANDKLEELLLAAMPS